LSRAEMKKKAAGGGCSKTWVIFALADRDSKGRFESTSEIMIQITVKIMEKNMTAKRIHVSM